ncbi:septum formation protein Maf [candidate division WOR-3 bacterium]|nr:septum formation protein Maf [candidate division WOR-3 bacterium]
MHIYLASTSPRRRDLLRRLGIRFQLTTPAASETPEAVGHKTGSTPARFAVACARVKALSVAGRVNAGLVVGVDTVVVCGKQILGKPRSRAEARKMLGMLSGRTHSVISGVAVVRMPERRVLTAAETTAVSFRRLSTDEIERYISGPEPYDKAGAYGIQEQAGIFVSRVSGCLLNVVGLPVPLLLDLLCKAGWQPAS